MKQKIRTIITQDAEVDDRNSLRHFLLYANEVDLQGIVQTSSKFHWIGVPGAVKPEKDMSQKVDFDFEESGSYGQPYRWPGTDWMMQVIDDYEKDLPNLRKHAEGYPDAEYLRSVTRVGNIGYEGETEAPSEGSELIRSRILDDDDRTLYIQVWGGTNTIARALMDIEKEFAGTEIWPELHRKISEKVVMTACGEQDGTYRSYIAEVWPDMKFVRTLQMRSYAYPWFVMPECDSKDTLKPAFMKKEILDSGSALAAGYCTWLDGNRYPGEGEADQFGANPNIADEWFGSRMGIRGIEPYAFLSEGDSPTYFLLFDWGLRSLEDLTWGGMSGRYRKLEGEVNSKGQPLNLWDVAMDDFTDREGRVSSLESMWIHVAEIQRDFAARCRWTRAESFEEGEHKPKLRVKEGTDLKARPGESISLTAETESPDGLPVAVTFRIYREAGESRTAGAELKAENNTALVTMPAEALPGDQLHVIVKAEAQGHHRLVYFRQVIITAE